MAKEQMGAKEFMDKVTNLAKAGKNTAEIMEALELTSAVFNSRLVKNAMETGIPIPKMTIGRKKPADRTWAKVKVDNTFVVGLQFATHLQVKPGHHVEFKATTLEGKNVVVVSRKLQEPGK